MASDTFATDGRHGVARSISPLDRCLPGRVLDTSNSASPPSRILAATTVAGAAAAAAAAETSFSNPSPRKPHRNRLYSRSFSKNLEAFTQSKKSDSFDLLRQTLPAASPSTKKESSWGFIPNQNLRELSSPDSYSTASESSQNEIFDYLIRPEASSEASTAPNSPVAQDKAEFDSHRRVRLEAVDVFFDAKGEAREEKKHRCRDTVDIAKVENGRMEKLDATPIHRTQVPIAQRKSEARWMLQTPIIHPEELKEGYGVKPAELSPQQISREKRKIMLRKLSYGRREELEAACKDNLEFRRYRALDSFNLPLNARWSDFFKGLKLGFRKGDLCVVL